MVWSMIVCNHMISCPEAVWVLSYWTTKLHFASGDALGNSAFRLLDQTVGAKCLARLLGVGSNRLRKSMSGAPDLRFGRREHRSRPQTYTVDAFLQIAYESIAETLPDRLLGKNDNIFATFLMAKSNPKHFKFQQNMTPPNCSMTP